MTKITQHRAPIGLNDITQFKLCYEVFGTGKATSTSYCETIKMDMKVFAYFGHSV